MSFTDIRLCFLVLLVAFATAAEDTNNEAEWVNRPLKKVHLETEKIRIPRSIGNIARLLLGGNVPPDHPLVKYPDPILSASSVPQNVIAAVPGMTGTVQEGSRPQQGAVQYQQQMMSGDAPIPSVVQPTYGVNAHPFGNQVTVQSQQPQPNYGPPSNNYAQPQYSQPQSQQPQQAQSTFQISQWQNNPATSGGYSSGPGGYQGQQQQFAQQAQQAPPPSGNYASPAYNAPSQSFGSQPSSGQAAGNTQTPFNPGYNQASGGFNSNPQNGNAGSSSGSGGYAQPPVYSPPQPSSSYNAQQQPFNSYSPPPQQQSFPAQAQQSYQAPSQNYQPAPPSAQYSAPQNGPSQTGSSYSRLPDSYSPNQPNGYNSPGNSINNMIAQPSNTYQSPAPQPQQNTFGGYSTLPATSSNYQAPGSSYGPPNSAPVGGYNNAPAQNQNGAVSFNNQPSPTQPPANNYNPYGAPLPSASPSYQPPNSGYNSYAPPAPPAPPAPSPVPNSYNAPGSGYNSYAPPPPSNTGSGSGYNSYAPPSNAGSGYNSPAAPSGSYGPPPSGSFGPPASNSYEAPTPPPNSYGPPAPSSSYNPGPTQSSGSSYLSPPPALNNQPSTTYGGYNAPPTVAPLKTDYVQNSYPSLPAQSYGGYPSSSGSKGEVSSDGYGVPKAEPLDSYQPQKDSYGLPKAPEAPDSYQPLNDGYGIPKGEPLSSYRPQNDGYGVPKAEPLDTYRPSYSAPSSSYGAPKASEYDAYRPKASSYKSEYGAPSSSSSSSSGYPKGPPRYSSKGSTSSISYGPPKSTYGKYRPKVANSAEYTYSTIKSPYESESYRTPTPVYKGYKKDVASYYRSAEPSRYTAPSYEYAESDYRRSSSSGSSGSSKSSRYPSSSSPVSSSSSSSSRSQRRLAADAKPRSASAPKREGYSSSRSKDSRREPPVYGNDSLELFKGLQVSRSSRSPVLDYADAPIDKQGLPVKDPKVIPSLAIFTTSYI